ncbi:inositol-pentakisphosphate 2-kinase [Lactarius akahatsu]|uniref:Inositol-pentakisphosphate 2-kinase n=1 Tax=Lactarius akahatsu TaxID=416441 RepID=A0AAD4LS34_9AGAM|nr:inositol-pentakisphosphate 2-kinase [Lactarius akahatsu]
MFMLSQTSPTDWKYLSEGGATAVFSYRGHPHPILTGKVLRLRKTSSQAGGRPIDIDIPEPAVTFQQNIISRLVDPTYLVDLQIVPLETHWVETFSLHHELSRPPERRSTSTIDNSKRTAVLASDLVGGIPCAVEVKPKWGFLPNPTHLSPESKPIKTRTCRTCMHTHLKQTEGNNVAVHYCPLDLFSGSRERLEIALEGLWNSWTQSNGAINNLRIFHYGKMVLPTDELGLQVWSQETLSLPPDAPITSIKSKFISALLPLFLHNSLLQHISALQRSLDPLDCEGFAKLVESKRIQSAGSSDSINAALPIADLTQPTMDDWTSFVDIFLSQERQKHSSFSPSNLRYHTLAYLLSASFKDCSLIVPIRSQTDVTEMDGIKVIDLDIKVVDRIPGWSKLDKKIVREYAKIDTGLRKTCTEVSSGT